MPNDRINKDAHYYANKVMEVTGEALGYNDFSKKNWVKKYGKQCLYHAVVKILKKAMREK